MFERKLAKTNKYKIRAITRNIKSDISSLSVSIYAFLATTIGGVLLIPFSNTFVVLSSLQLYLILLSAVIASFSYFMLVLATRKGNVSVISPFRYTRLLFALILAVFILGERPDIYTLVGGTFTFIVADANAQTFMSTYTINSPLELSATYTVSNVSTAGGSDGSIDLSPFGGTPPYLYYWSNGANTEDLNNLSVGTYTVYLVDANNCYTGFDIYVV